MAKKIFISYKICISFSSILGDSYGSKYIHILQDMHISLLDSKNTYCPKDIHILQDMHIFLLDSRRLLLHKRYSYLTRYAYLLARF